MFLSNINKLKGGYKMSDFDLDDEDVSEEDDDEGMNEDLSDDY